MSSPPLPNFEQNLISVPKRTQTMKTVPPAKPAHGCQRIITLEILTPREGNLRLGVSDNHTQNGCWIPSLIQNLHRFHCQHIKVQIFLVDLVAKNLGGLRVLE